VRKGDTEVVVSLVETFLEFQVEPEETEWRTHPFSFCNSFCHFLGSEGRKIFVPVVPKA